MDDIQKNMFDLIDAVVCFHGGYKAISNIIYEFLNVCPKVIHIDELTDGHDIEYLSYDMFDVSVKYLTDKEMYLTDWINKYINLDIYLEGTIVDARKYHEDYRDNGMLLIDIGADGKNRISSHVDNSGCHWLGFSYFDKKITPPNCNLYISIDNINNKDIFKKVCMISEEIKKHGDCAKYITYIMAKKYTIYSWDTRDIEVCKHEDGIYWS